MFVLLTGGHCGTHTHTHQNSYFLALMLIHPFSRRACLGHTCYCGGKSEITVVPGITNSNTVRITFVSYGTLDYRSVDEMPARQGT